AVPFYLPEGG
nr:Chain B, head involution defective protein [synthetic construct]